MVIARVAYGKSVDSVQQTLSSLHLADIHQRSIATGPATVDLHIQTQREPVVGGLQEETPTAFQLNATEKV